MKLSKEAIKSYLESVSAESMMKQLKDGIDNPDNFKDFKSEFTDLLQKYINNPTSANRRALDTLISRNYTEGNLFARESLEHILSDLGFRPGMTRSGAPSETEKSKGKGRDLEEVRQIYEDLGIEYPGDTLKKVLARLEEVDSQPQRSEKKRKVKKPNPSKSKVKKEGKFRKTIRTRFAHLKNSISEKIQNSQIQEVEDVLSGMEILKKNLLTAKAGILSEISPEELENMPEDVRTRQEQLDTMEEEELKEFKVDVSAQVEERLVKIRETLKIMERKKLEEKLRALAIDSSDMPSEEIEEEIEDVIEYAKVDQEGEIVLPKHAAFQKVFFDEEGELYEEHAETAKQISDYILRFEELELTDKELAELMSQLRSPENAEVLPENLEEFERAYQEYVALKKLEEVLDISHKISVLTDVEKQVQEIHTVVKTYQEKQQTEEGLEKEEERKRKIALQIAKKKVKALEKANLGDLITEEIKEWDKILHEAQQILLPKLERARDVGEKKWQREFLEEQENDEEEREDD